jgi:hypothetical protein
VRVVRRCGSATPLVSRCPYFYFRLVFLPRVCHMFAMRFRSPTPSFLRTTCLLFPTSTILLHNSRLSRILLRSTLGTGSDVYKVSYSRSMSPVEFPPPSSVSRLFSPREPARFRVRSTKKTTRTLTLVAFFSSIDSGILFQISRSTDFCFVLGLYCDCRR